jgi:hypothetical protein
MIPITMSLFTALSAWLTLRALDRRGFADFGLAGFALGVGLWFYAAFQLFPLVIAFMLAHHYIVQKPPFGRFVAQIIFMGVVDLLVVLPVAQFAYTNPDVYFARIGDTSIWSNTPFGEAFDQGRESFGKHLRMFHFEGDHNPRHNLPGAPMLDIATGLLLVAGAAVALFNWRKTALIVLPVWVIVMLMPGVLTLPFEAPQALRSIGVLPAVVVLAALPLAMLARAIIGAGSWGGRALGLTVVCAVLTVVGYSNVNTYFGEQAADPAVYAAYSTDGTLVGRDMVRQQAKGYTLLASRQFKFSLQIDLAGNRPVYDVIRAPQDVPLAAERVNAGAAIYLEPREKGAFRLLKAYYPDGHFEEVRAPNGGEPLYYLAVLTREQLGERQGLIATYTAADGARTEQVLGSTQALWPLELDEDSLPVDVIWEGALHAREPGEYLFMLEGDTGLHVSLDGQPVLTPEARTARVELAVGLHEIAVAGQVDSGDEFARLVWQPPGGDVAVIPAANLYHGVIRPYGLAGNFYADGLESDTPDAMRVTPFMDTFWYDPVLPEPYSAVWEGELLASDDGGYRFRVSGFGDVRLSVDGLLVASSDGLTGLSDDSIILRAGWHSVQIRYSSPHPPSEFEILWTPPDGAEGDIPIEYLRPAPDRMIRLIE